MSEKSKEFSDADRLFLKGLMANEEDIISDKHLDEVLKKRLPEVAKRYGYLEVDGILRYVGKESTDAEIDANVVRIKATPSDELSESEKVLKEELLYVENNIDQLVAEADAFLDAEEKSKSDGD